MPCIRDIINALLFWSKQIEACDSKKAVNAFLHHSRLDIGALRIMARDMACCPNTSIGLDCIPESLQDNPNVQESCFLSRLLLERLELESVSCKSKNELAIILCWLHLEGTISNKKLPEKTSQEALHNSRLTISEKPPR